MRFKEVKLLNQDNEPRSVFNSDETIKIHVAYECLDTVDNLRVNICIVDEENREILTTTTADDEREGNSYRKDAGIYASVCHIQPNLFGEKRLFVTVHLEYPKVEHLVLDRILGFDVIFLGYNNISAAFKNSFIRPCLKWETQLLDLTNRS